MRKKAGSGDWERGYIGIYMACVAMLYLIFSIILLVSPRKRWDHLTNTTQPVVNTSVSDVHVLLVVNESTSMQPSVSLPF